MGTQPTYLRLFSKFICAAILLVASTFRSYATLDFYESFNYTNVNAPLYIAASNPQSTNWVPYFGGGIHPTNISGSLSYPGLFTEPADNSVLFNGSSPFITGIAARNLSRHYDITSGPTLYYSLTFKVVSITTNDWGVADDWIHGAVMLGFNQKLRNGTAMAQGDMAAPLLIRTGNPSNVNNNASDFQEYQLGVGVTATVGADVFDATHNYHPGDVLFLVVSYTFNSGTHSDVAKLYVNPIPGSLETNNTPVVLATAGFLNDVNGNQIQSFFLRNNGAEPNSTQVDDLRIGTTWEDVTPAVPTLRVDSVLPNLVLSWPTNSPGFTLESNNGLSTPGWETVLFPVGTVGDRFYVTNDSLRGDSFFRLRR